MECLFRRAGRSDREPVIALIFETLRSFGVEPDPEGIDSSVMTFGAGGDTDIDEFVAEVDGRVVGSIALRRRPDSTGHISKFFVSASQRGRGIGRRLLELAIEEARRRKLYRLDLETRTFFESAIHLYESTGWRRGPDPPNVCDRAYILQLEYVK
jgi:ribosomal protein S18 acetylase RimI-like enzyme